jgi:hypothetical protein
MEEKEKKPLCKQDKGKAEQFAVSGYNGRVFRVFHRCPHGRRIYPYKMASASVPER